jgi:subtilisin family serine protease
MLVSVKKRILFIILLLLIAVSAAIFTKGFMKADKETSEIPLKDSTKASVIKSSEETSASNTKIKLTEYADVRRIAGAKDLQGDLSQINFSGNEEIIPTLTFNTATIWPKDLKLPQGFMPQEIMEYGMNPGLGIRELHKEGITGKSVNVAIIDQPLFLDHPEYTGKIKAYNNFTGKSESSMHGPAVASLLVGDNIGTAPEANLYYAAVPSWLADSSYYAKALDWIVEENRKLPKESKIRVVSISAAPSGAGSPFTKNTEMWDESVKRAEAEGILILDCTSNHGIVGPCYYDLKDREDVAKCLPGFPNAKGFFRNSKAILVPTSIRTVAEHYYEKGYAYQYTGVGGLSWAIPYCSGVLAMGWQVNPTLSPQEMVDILFLSSYEKDGNKYINPKKFIEELK